jgi:hypothetical protein
MGEKRNACRILVGKPEGKRPLGRPRRRWVNNIKMDLREIEFFGHPRSPDDGLVFVVGLSVFIILFVVLHVVTAVF